MNYEEIINSKAFIDWFGDWKRAYEEAGLNFNHRAWRGVSKVVDQDGKPMISYHGTTHEWTKYSRKLGNHDNDMGIGFYSTSSISDAKGNYLSEGYDLTHKIETYAEHYSQEKDLPYEKAKKIFEKRLKGDTEKVIEVFLKIKNPLIISISGKGGTYLDFSYNTDEDENYEDSKDFVKFKEAFDEVFEDFDLSNDVNIRVWSEFLENLGELDYTSAYQIIRALKESYTLLDWTSNEKSGGTMQFEIISQIFQKYGFDGVIYLDASEHFKNMNISRGTKHFIAFKPKQLKLADGTNTTFDSKNPDIRFDEGGSVGFVVENLPDDYKEIYQIRAYKIIDGSKFYFSRLTYSEDNVFIIELEGGSEIGRATLNEVNNYLTNIRINDKYRRKGLASSLYDFIEYVVGKKLKPSPDKISNEAKGLWTKRNPDIRFDDGGDVKYERNYTDDGNKIVVYSTKDYKIAVDDINKARYITLWFVNSLFDLDVKVGSLALHETEDGFLKVQEIEIQKQHRGKGMATKMYLMALKYSSDNIKGIKSYLPDRVNKRQIPKIYKRLNGKIEEDWAYMYKSDNINQFENGGDVIVKENLNNINLEQYKLVRTPEFKSWFGDWEKSPEKASKMVNEKGEPLICFHGTNESFNEFSYKAIGSANDYGFYGKGFYFTFQRESKNTQWAMSEALYYGKKLIPVFLNVRNPFNFDTLTQYKGVSINYLGTQSLVFLYNISKLFSKISNQIFLDKRLPKDKGEYYIEKTPISVLPELIEKYSNELKTQIRQGSNGEQVVEGYVKSKIVEYDYTEHGGKKGSYEEKEFLNGSFPIESNRYSKEELEILFIELALEKYEGLKVSFYVQGYMTRNPQITDAIKENHDGIIQAEYGDEVIVFNPTQIKLADGTNTTFDGTNPDIRYDKGGDVSEINSLYKEHHEVWEISESIIKDLCEENCAIYSNKIADLYESELKPHFEEEESSFFPSILNDENSKIIEELEDEHEYMEYMIYKIKKYNKASDIKSFCNYIKEHIKKEESLMKTIAPDPYMEVEEAK